MFASRVESLKAEGDYEILACAKELERQGHSVIHLEIGEPDQATFENIRQAGVEAIQRGLTRYTPSAGELELREAIAEDAGRRRGIQINPTQVVISPGAKPNLFFPVLALVVCTGHDCLGIFDELAREYAAHDQIVVRSC